MRPGPRPGPGGCRWWAAGPGPGMRPPCRRSRSVPGGPVSTGRRGYREEFSPRQRPESFTIMESGAARERVLGRIRSAADAADGAARDVAAEYAALPRGYLRAHHDPAAHDIVA